MPHPKNGYHINGKKVPGVTTIIGRFKDSGALLYWAFEQGKAAERGEISKLYDRRDEAAEAGTLAHSMVEAHINKQPLPCLDEYPEEIAKKAQRGFDNYIQWSDNNRITITHQEVALVSNIYEFGGCLDAVGWDAVGRRCLIDWKTSNSVYQDYIVQLGAYAILWEENHPDELFDGGFHLCRFSKEHADFSHHYWSDLNDARKLFLHYREAYDLDKSLKKRI